MTRIREAATEADIVSVKYHIEQIARAYELTPSQVASAFAQSYEEVGR